MHPMDTWPWVGSETAAATQLHSRVVVTNQSKLVCAGKTQDPANGARQRPTSASGEPRVFVPPPGLHSARSTPSLPARPGFRQPGRARSAPSGEPRATPTASAGSPARHVAVVPRPPGPQHRPAHLEPDSPGWPSAPWNMSAAAPRLSSRRAAVPAWSLAGTQTRPSPLDASRANHTSAAYRRVIPRPSPCSNERQAWRVPHRAYSRLAPASASHGFRRRHWTTARPTLRH